MAQEEARGEDLRKVPSLQPTKLPALGGFDEQNLGRKQDGSAKGLKDAQRESPDQAALVADAGKGQRKATPRITHPSSRCRVVQLREGNPQSIRDFAVGLKCRLVREAEQKGMNPEHFSQVASREVGGECSEGLVRCKRYPDLFARFADGGV